MEGYVMSDFNWCHGPECHKKHTQLIEFEVLRAQRF
jgi:hypothetical protein